MTLKEFIKSKREEKSYSQKRLAKILGYSSGQFISNWERGESFPPIDRLAKMALLFEVDKDYLLDLYLKDNAALKIKEYEKALKFHEYQLKTAR